MDLASIVADKTSPTAVARFVFDKLIAQGVPAVQQSNAMCAYRLRDDSLPSLPSRSASPIRCGIGHLIADDKYDEGIESEAAITALNACYGRDWVRTHLSLEMMDLLGFIQSVHDHIGRDGDEITIDTLYNSIENCNDDRVMNADGDEDPQICHAASIALVALAAIKKGEPA